MRITQARCRWSRSDVDFRPNGWLAPCESAHGTVLNLFIFAKNKSGERNLWADHVS